METWDDLAAELGDGLVRAVDKAVCEALGKYRAPILRDEHYLVSEDIAFTVLLAIREARSTSAIRKGGRTVGTHQAWVDLIRVTPENGDIESVPACGEPSPTGAMLCDLPRTEFGHYLGQHLGVDRHGNFRGWPDNRAYRG